MKGVRTIILVAALASLLVPSAAVPHPDHGPPPVTPQVSAPADDGGSGGTNGLVIAAVAVGLIGLALGLGSLKYLQTQKTRAGQTEQADTAAPKRGTAPGGATPART